MNKRKSLADVAGIPVKRSRMNAVFPTAFMPFDALPASVFRTILPKFRETPQLCDEGFLSCQDARRLSLVNKFCHQIVWEHQAFIQDVNLSKLGNRHILEMVIRDIVKRPIRSCDLHDCKVSIRHVLPLLGQVHKLNLSNCTGVLNLSSLKNVHTLDLSQCSKLDLKALVNVRHLTLRGTSTITNLETLEKLQSLYVCIRNTNTSTIGDMLNTMRDLRVLKARSIDIATANLSNLEELTVIPDSFVVDVMNFNLVLNNQTAKKLKYLSLASLVTNNNIDRVEEFCANSPSLETIDLRYCPKLIVHDDVYMFIQSAKKLSGILSLGNLRHLILTGSNISDVSMMGNLQILELERCPVIDVSALSRVMCLKLDYCKQMDLTTLMKIAGNQRILSVGGLEFRKNGKHKTNADIKLDVKGIRHFIARETAHVSWSNIIHRYQSFEIF